MFYIEKKYLVYISLFFILVLFILLFFEDKYKKELNFSKKLENNISYKNKVKEKINNKIDIKYEKITKKDSEKIILKEEINNSIDIEENNDEHELEYKLKKTNVFNYPTKNGNFAITIISDIKIKKEYMGSLIPIRGELYFDNKRTNFSLSLPFDYKNHQESDLYIQVTNINKDTNVKCDGYFLKYLDEEYIYTMKIEVFDNYADCYISDQKKLPSFKSPFEKKDGEFIDINSLENGMKFRKSGKND